MNNTNTYCTSNLHYPLKKILFLSAVYICRRVRYSFTFPKWKVYTRVYTEILYPVLHSQIRQIEIHMVISVVKVRFGNHDRFDWSSKFQNCSLPRALQKKTVTINFPKKYHDLTMITRCTTVTAKSCSMPSGSSIIAAFKRAEKVSAARQPPQQKAVH